MKRRYLIALAILVLGSSLAAQNTFGAFKIVTSPQGANISLSGTNQYIGQSPTDAIPVQMDQFMGYMYGIPGRYFLLEISKQGFITQTQQIFVPFNRAHQQGALRNPTVFHFQLQRRPQFDPPDWPGHNAGHSEQNPGHGHGGGYQNQSELIIDTSPSGAAIYINNEYVGRSPLRVDLKRRYRLQNTIEIRAEKRGYRDATTILRPRQNRVMLNLRPRRPFWRF